MSQLRSVALVLLLAVPQCTDQGGVKVGLELPQADGEVTAVFDTQLERTSAPADLVELEAVPEMWADHDGAADVVENCGPGEGCFLAPCEQNSDCDSGWCVQHMGESVCSRACQEECPEGWGCKQVAGTDPDVVFICVSTYANLCKPCASGSDCTSPGGSADACLSYGAEGNFCGGGCGTEMGCPWGFSCQLSTTTDGVELSQCVADADVCPCTGTSVALGLWTPCGWENEFGLCEGKRVCLEGGLGECDALVPAAELCNGLDDDCDGEIDEEGNTDSGLACDDGNSCTEDVCQGAGGCDFVPLDGGECLDGNPCTVADHCVAGVCVGDPVMCEDENPCTDNVCMENGGCQYPVNSANCDDEDPCTVGDSCVEGDCQGYAVACDCQIDQDCAALEDGDLCNGTLVCDTDGLPFQCVVDPETEVACAAPEGVDAPCLEPACDAATGACSLVPANDGFACSDGDACTLSDSCLDGVCAAGLAANCNDGNPCTDDSCEANGGCVHTDNSLACDDGDVCTVGNQCVGGECVATGILACDDGNVCTVDLCDSLIGCTHQPGPGICDDGNSCTTGDHCDGGKCVFSGVTQCADDNPCTTDSCDVESGCVFSLNEAPCDDGDLCTYGDHCHLGACIDSGSIDCDDGNGCTDDSCTALGGCAHVPNAAICDDSNFCTTNDKCVAGVCQAGGNLTCDDGSSCTLDVCAWDQGCQFLPLPNGSDCVQDGICLGECQAGVCLDLASEVCDGQDNDCDGKVDEDYPDTDADKQADCVDVDDDGDGSLDLDDCLPLDPGVHPGADEICGNGIDEDCSGADMPDSDNDGVCDPVDLCPDGDDSADDDNDGVPDDCDVCPDHADGLDADEDGVPDGCDICHAGNDADDEDNDTIPDACDVCPGGDDLIDADNNGIPDACDSECLGLDANGDGIGDNCELSVLIVDGYGSDRLHDFLVGWGFSVSVVGGGSLGAGYDYSGYDVVGFMYDSSIANAAHLASENAAGKVGIVFPRGDSVVDDFGMGSAGYYQSGAFSIGDNTHFISQVFQPGVLDLSYTYKSRLKSPTGNVKVLGTVEEASLVVHKHYRRVVTPYYAHTDQMPWSSDAAVLTWRSYVWAAGFGGQ